MKVVYTHEPILVRPSIFLAGPTPRSSEVLSWRPEALALLEGFGFEGSVLVPESRTGRCLLDLPDQVNWELDSLDVADVVAFWVPRDLETLPGFTTNVEFGYLVRSGKCVLGAPPHAPKTQYLRHLASRHSVPQASSLVLTMELAVVYLSRKGF